MFPDLTIETAPAASRRALTAVRDHWGYLPAGAARLAGSPHALDGFLKLNGIFEACTLDPLARETLIMTIATRNGCHLCVAIHTQRLTAMGADADVIEALRSPAPVPGPDGPRLEAMRSFVLRALDTTGDVGEAAIQEFLAHGYTTQNALEVMLGIGAYTLSTFANRLTGAPLDPPLAAFAAPA